MPRVGIVLVAGLVLKLWTLDCAHAGRAGQGRRVASVKSAVPAGWVKGEYSKTAGIVAQIFGNAVAVSSDLKNARVLNQPGQGVGVGEWIWVARGAFVRIVASEYGVVESSGPSVFNLVSASKMKLFRGQMHLNASHADRPLEFETIYAAGRVKGSAIIWASTEHPLVQMLAFHGSIRAWHPAVTAAAVEIPQGYFSESSGKSNFLEPSKPRLIDEPTAKHFVAGHFNLRHVPAAESSESRRTIASHGTYRGSRYIPNKPASAAEVARSGINTTSWLLAKASGSDISTLEEDEERPLVVAGPELTAKRRSRTRKVAARIPGKAQFEVRAAGKNLDEEGVRLLQKLGL